MISLLGVLNSFITGLPVVDNLEHEPRFRMVSKITNLHGPTLETLLKSLKNAQRQHLGTLSNVGRKLTFSLSKLSIVLNMGEFI